MADKCAPVFAADKTHNLIVRLRHNVIRTGLRRINVSYSRIALGDVAKKLRLDTPTPAEDAECIVAKVRFWFRFSQVDEGSDSCPFQKIAFLEKREWES